MAQSLSSSSSAYKVERPLSVSFRLPKSLEADGVFPTRGLVLREVVDVIGGKEKLICFQRLSGTHYEVTFKASQTEARNKLLNAGFLLQSTPVHVFECDPKYTSVTVKNLPAEVPDQHLMALLSTYGTVVRAKHVLDDEGIWTGDRVVEMVVSSDIPSMIKLGMYPIVIRYRGQKLCCHYCNRWGHPIAECPYKIHNLCIRCAKAGYSARFCEHPWVLDNSPVEYVDLPYTPTPPDMQLSTMEMSSSAPQPSETVTQDDYSYLPSGSKRSAEGAKPKKKKNKKVKENPAAFEQEDFDIQSLPFTDKPLDDPITSLISINPFAALVIEDDEDMVPETPTQDQPANKKTNAAVPSATDTATQELFTPSQNSSAPASQSISKAHNNVPVPPSKPPAVAASTSPQPKHTAAAPTTTVPPPKANAAPPAQPQATAKHSMVASLSRRLSNVYRPVSTQIAPARVPTQPLRVSFKSKSKNK